ncbi:MAG: hypothetical protein ACFCUR_20030, partial [Rhodomicrobiaceae bacterium]
SPATRAFHLVSQAQAPQSRYQLRFPYRNPRRLTIHDFTLIIEAERLDEWTLGWMMMHFIVETILAADLMGVDSFDQPAVELGKRLTRDYLARMVR